MNYFKNLNGDNELFGPGTDLIISLVAILIMVLAIYLNEYGKREEILKKIEKEQKEIVKEIARKYKSPIDSLTLGEKTYGISATSQNDIIIHNDLTLQRISFGSNILFQPDDTLLNFNGKNVLSVVGISIKKKLPVIKEIQIQGHADPNKSNKFGSNLELAAHRAISVFYFFQNKLNIDPAQYIMSATSFGEYKPVERSYENIKYNIDSIYHANETEKQRDRNRRIEIVLNYREDNDN